MRFIEDTSNIIVSEDIPLRDALQQLDQNGFQILVVTNEARNVVGLITDGDVRRYILYGGNLEVKASEVTNTDFVYLTHNNIEKADELLNKNSINHLPILGTNGCLESLVVRNNINYSISSNSKVPIVIMAGGKGSRLLPLTRIIPKPLIPVGSETMLEKIINNFQAAGFNQFRVIVNYKKELIKSYMNGINHSYDLQFIEEEEYSGTAGGLSLLKEHIEGEFILTNCDIISFLNYQSMLSWHKDHDAELTILGVRKRIDVPYGVLSINNESYVTEIKEKPKYNHLIVSGIYILNSSVLKMIPEGKTLGMDQLINKLLTDGKKVTCYPVDGGWHDMGQFKEYKDLVKNIGDTDD
jgi:dTDP-glucose pyrophosphorylase